MVIIALVVSVLTGLSVGSGARWIVRGPDPLGRFGACQPGATFFRKECT